MSSEGQLGSTRSSEAVGLASVLDNKFAKLRKSATLSNQWPLLRLEQLPPQILDAAVRRLAVIGQPQP